jgi:hypothetical protein
MAGLFPALAVTYALGVVVGLVATDARPAARLGLALTWPIGPIAFVATVALLLAVTPVAFSGRR